MVASIAASELEKVQGGFKNAGMAPMAIAVFAGPTGGHAILASGTRSATSASAVFRHDLGEGKVSDELARTPRSPWSIWRRRRGCSCQQQANVPPSRCKRPKRH